MSWCTIESDPGVFSDLISKIGVPNIDVEEIYGLEDLLVSDEASSVSSGVGELKLSSSQKFGLIFLFKYSGEISDDRATIPFEDSPNLYFAKQVVQDACATQAILSVLLNTEIELGPNLTDFKNFTQCLDYEMRGLSIGNSDHIRDVHNSFGRPEPFIYEKSANKDRKNTKDAYHFIAYVPSSGQVYELDGLKAGPIALGTYGESGSDGGNWLQVAAKAVGDRIASLNASGKEISFSLMLITHDKASLIEARIHELEAQQASCTDSADASLLANLQSLRDQLADLHEVKANQAKENIRRQHNYVPFIVSLLREMGLKKLD